MQEMNKNIVMYALHENRYLQQTPLALKRETLTVCNCDVGSHLVTQVLHTDASSTALNQRPALPRAVSKSCMRRLLDHVNAISEKVWE